MASLPPGVGPKQGETVYLAKCVACHGEKGAGKPTISGLARESLPATNPSENGRKLLALCTTIFTAAGARCLTTIEIADQPRGLCCGRLLQLNGVVGESDTIDARTLPKVKMPNRDGFVTFARGK
jgi:cytochrome c